MNFYEEYVHSYNVTPENEPEFFSLISDLYFTEEIQGQAQYIQHADINRLQHMTSVAYMSYVRAKEEGCDYKSVARAGILHDLVYYDWHVAGDGSHRLHGYRHPRFALKNAKVLCELSPLEEGIIIRHMWPLTVIPPKSKEGMILSIVDKYCATHEIIINKSQRYRENFRNDIIKNKM